MLRDVWSGRASANFELEEDRTREGLCGLIHPEEETLSSTPDEQLLSDALLLQMAKRAASYDEENRFFHEDFADLRDAGYLTACVPREFGGSGVDLATLCRAQRRLGYHAPATALGIHMHLIWPGVAADLWRRGDNVTGVAAAGSGRGRGVRLRPFRAGKRSASPAFHE
jgi:alkylation response protein AidB-like acyl-CoA dehydrogenase